MTASLIGKQVGFDLSTDSEFGTSNWGFDIDFPIIGYLSIDSSQFVCVLAYHNSGKHAFSTAKVDWLITMDTSDFGND
ncbi:hypothetical protein G9A89_015621 [Geosiphon pyriformis]|nr:hypothetical protein G9A89_015621 [Geosiphon pyriformis]